MIKHFTKNTEGCDFVVGDIHGCFSEFEKCLEEINFNPEIDRIFSVGDLVDRGPESCRCLEFLAKPWFHACLGNHEVMCLDIISGRSMVGLHPQNGGMWILEQENPDAFAEAFKKMPLIIEVETDRGLIGIIHAECPVDDWFTLSFHKNNKSVHNVCIWSRELIHNKSELRVKNIHTVFHGHTVLENPIQLGNRVYIDTGLVFKGTEFNGKLTIIKL